MAIPNSTETGGLEDFCKGDFWDLNLTWNTSHPDLTQCFQKTVLVWVPCGFLWLVTPFYACYLSSCNGPSIPRNRLNKTKSLVNILLFLLSCANLIKGAVDYSNNDDAPLVDIVSPLIMAISFVIAAILVQIERSKGFITSGILFLFYTLLVITGLVPFYSKIYNAVSGHDGEADDEIHDLFRFITFYIYYFFLLVAFVLSCITDALPYHPILPAGKEPCPETEASFLSRITFWWLNGLVLAGYRKPLDEDDLWALHPRDVTKNTYPVFNKEWEAELDRVNWHNGTDKKQSVLARATSYMGGSQTYVPQASKTSNSDEKTPLLKSEFKATPDVEVTQPKQKKKEPSLFKTLTKCYGLTLLQAHLCKLVCDVLTFVGPTLQRLLIGYTEDTTMQEWKGYMYAALFLVSSVVNSFFFHQLFHIGMTLGMRIKAAVIASVYQKALSMSNEARKTSTVGEIVNLMSVDAQRLQDVTGYLWMIWSAPFQIAVAIYLLYDIIGISVMAGLAVMILLIPVNGVLATVQRKLQIAQMTQKDQRIKLMNEVLNGMKVLKLYAWELSFKEKVNAIRDMELDTLKKYSYLGAVGTFTWTCAPFLVTLATFAAYVLSGGVLDAEKAFVSLSLFNILRFPINMLPMIISYLVTASVSIKRLGAFLQYGDLDLDSVQHDPNAPDPITITDGTFSWGTDKDDLPILKDVNIEIKEKSLTAVVGQVGAGKSSLISAILGEMEKLKGHVNVRGTVAYVAQQAWIQNATLRDNITFGKPFDEERYDKVLDACALKPDLEILPGGDLTEIGEKGINLSGGQKQRVSLARAVYQDCDLYYLDDPLSAVDSHVGKHIFENIVCDTGMLAGKTRILVTHGVHWLPKVDTIIVLVKGEVTEIGSYEELLSNAGAFAEFLKTYFTQVDSDDSEEDEEVQKLKNEILQRVESIAPSEEGASAAAKSKSGSDRDSASGTSSRRRKKKKVPTATLR